MKTIKILLLCLSARSPVSFEFNSGGEDTGCSSTQSCVTASDCPAVVREFKLRNIQPQICRFRPRSVMICCEESDRPVTSSPASPLSAECPTPGGYSTSTSGPG